jgi:phosphatidate phosphatase PAH1
MERAYYLFQSRSYNSITDTLRMQNALTEYELFKTDQKTLAEEEKALIEASTKYTDIEKNNRKLLVDAVLNRILRTQSLLMITSHLFSEYNLHKNEVMDVIELLTKQDPNYNLRHFPPGAIRRGFTNDPPYDLVYLLGFIEERIPKIQDKEEEQKGAVKNMIEQMKKIHSQRGANELNYDIIEDEVIGNGSNGVWGRYQWWSVKDLDVIFIEPW